MLALAARHAVTAIYNARQFTATGGLRSYGASLADAYRLQEARKPTLPPVPNRNPKRRI